MGDAKTILEQAYSAFNKRDIDGALALMTRDVSWPKASEGGKVAGKEEIRAYWIRQWSEFDPHVEPLAIAEERGGKTRVRVHQLVKSLEKGIAAAIARRRQTGAAADRGPRGRSWRPYAIRFTSGCRERAAEFGWVATTPSSATSCLRPFRKHWMAAGRET